MLERFRFHSKSAEQANLQEADAQPVLSYDGFEKAPFRVVVDEGGVGKFMRKNGFQASDIAGLNIEIHAAGRMVVAGTARKDRVDLWVGTVYGDNLSAPLGAFMGALRGSKLDLFLLKRLGKHDVLKDQLSAEDETDAYSIAREILTKETQRELHSNLFHELAHVYDLRYERGFINRDRLVRTAVIFSGVWTYLTQMPYGGSVLANTAYVAGGAGLSLALQKFGYRFSAVEIRARSFAEEVTSDPTWNDLLKFNSVRSRWS